MPYLAHLSSANRPKQTYQGRPVHNACELFDTIDAKETNEANLLSALRRPRPAATGKSWHRKSELACAVGRGRKDSPPPTNRQLGESGPCIRRAEPASDSAKRGHNVAVRPPIGGLMNTMGLLMHL